MSALPRAECPGDADWDCVAYGPEGREVGALCFLARRERICVTLDDCRAAMTAERQRVFARINELAASGEKTAQYLAAEFATPDRLLNAENRL